MSELYPKLICFRLYRKTLTKIEIDLVSPHLKKQIFRFFGLRISQEQCGGCKVANKHF